MVVRTAATSEKAAEGQNATLEFILVNHPLDCPVCDKGGECPLQDLTFRYGPGNTRMTFPKITLEKPIPVSPLIALDRERCILCYRCTRFSSDVAEDNQLVARNRGAHTEIATFENEPYRAPFSGNVVELCPVGALTSTQYRFEARPWDIQNVPTVCGLCPVGCNVNATMREGKVKRILSRNHPGDRRGLALRQGALLVPAPHAPRTGSPSRSRAARSGSRPSRWDAALDRAEELLREAGTNSSPRSPARRRSSRRTRSDACSEAGSARTRPSCPESTSDALNAFRLPLSALAEAELVVVVGDDEVAERAPVVDLWLKAARRNGAEIVRYGPTGNVADGAGRRRGRTARADRARQPARASGCGPPTARSSIWSGSGGGGGARLAETAHALGFEGKPGCGAFHLPATPNGRGVADRLGGRRRRGRGRIPSRSGCCSSRATRPRPTRRVRALAERAERVIAVTMFHGLAVGWADLVLPATSYLERDGTLLNLEGRLQRLRRAVIAPVPDELAWIAKLAGRFDVERLAARDGRLRRGVRDRLRRHRPGGAERPRRAARRGRRTRRRRRQPRRRRRAAPRHAGRALPRRAAPAPLPPALLGPLRRARRGARVPAAAGRDRALRRGRRAPRGRERRHRRRALERHVGRASRPRQPEAR